jgi:hypothetical protein
MGHWRLAFQFTFADLLGYKYLLQVDDDSDFTVKETLNLTDFMQGKLFSGEATVLLECPYKMCQVDYCGCNSRPAALALALETKQVILSSEIVCCQVKGVTSLLDDFV